MFPYYGGKKALVKKRLYPEPAFSTIVEPFAGSAAYSMYHAAPDLDVVLIDKNPQLVEAWQYLLNARREDLLALPILNAGETLKDPRFAPLPDGAKKVISLMIHPHNNPGSFSTVPTQRNIWDLRRRQELVDNVEKIRRWHVVCGSYADAPDVAATWFIDPPYQKHADDHKSGGGGAHYGKHSNSKIDFDDLANFTLSRRGQVIATDRVSATWLPFEPLTVVKSQSAKRVPEGVFARMQPPFSVQAMRYTV